jgi:hypothetical protein
MSNLVDVEIESGVILRRAILLLHDPDFESESRCTCHADHDVQRLSATAAQAAFLDCDRKASLIQRLTSAHEEQHARHAASAGCN